MTTDPTPSKDRVEKDAEGQFGKSQADRKASGVASAKPTVITPGHSEDATIHNLPPGDDKPSDLKWNPPV